MKKSGISAFMLASILLLAGCSGNNAANPGSPAGESGRSAEPGGGDSGSDGPVTLTWWTMDTPSFVEANKKWIEAYKKAKPNVTINYQYFPYDIFIQKLKAAYASNTPPDVAQMFGTWVTDYAKNGHLLALEDDSVKNDIYDAPLGGYTYEGKLYGIPHEYNIENNGALAHKKMFDDSGIAYPPKTWAELMDAAGKLTVRDGNKIAVRGFDFTSTDAINFLFLAMILQQGGNYWTEDNDVDFNTPEAEKAFAAMSDMILAGKISDMTLFGTDEEPYMTFFKGNSAMTMAGPWVIAEGTGTFGVNDFDYMPIPPFAGDAPVFAAESGWGEVVSKASGHPREALDFIRFTADPEQAKMWNLATFTVPANKAVAADPDFTGQVALMKASLDSLEYGKWIGPVGDRDFWFKTVSDNFYAVVSGKLAAQDALRTITDSVNEMLARHK
ncbi:ABC transporter substrate-binding protein [Paenibacillus sp. MWE-103]|uniref:ABC transporter substrate-binding protein n=1 Tax=Paenibacillus artemisiicola TaxID=1172618 RepID=A0ABS3WJ47_9BACL|nr:ABC transporter substrate-binding protein [Paenibacillus artemisiicola]MBO7748349.1 ABC transporter substrate-binding protein [Paenibacillus artemisiicola]